MLKLEVIADDTVFYPWEAPFKVNTAKKVTISFDDVDMGPSYEIDDGVEKPKVTVTSAPKQEVMKAAEKQEEKPKQTKIAQKEKPKRKKSDVGALLARRYLK